AWVPRAELRIDPEPAPDPAEPEAAAGPSLRDRLIGLANEAQRAWRGHRFRRRRAEHPQWPVVVCEGDSWVAHPIIDDITDHLLDDDALPMHALGVGAAADLLQAMTQAHDHELAIEEHGARALLL